MVGRFALNELQQCLCPLRRAQAGISAGDTTGVAGRSVCPERQSVLRIVTSVRLCDAQVHRVTDQTCPAIADIQGEVSEENEPSLLSLVEIFLNLKDMCSEEIPELNLSVMAEVPPAEAVGQAVEVWPTAAKAGFPGSPPGAVKVAVQSAKEQLADRPNMDVEVAAPVPPGLEEIQEQLARSPSRDAEVGASDADSTPLHLLGLSE